jgi:hypothetical protein
MTQQTVPKCWGMILEWVWSDGMARILMTGVVPTPLSESVSMHLLAVCKSITG